MYKRIGRKTTVFFGVADLVKDTYSEIPSGSVDLYYTDPPWNNGNVKMFYTMLKKQTGLQKQPPPVSDLIGSVLRIAENKLSKNGVLIIETTVHEKTAILECVKKTNLQDAGEYQNYYKMGGVIRPYECRVFVRNNPNDFAGKFKGGMAGFDFLKSAIDLLAPNTFLDTSAGLGLITGEAIKKSVPFVYGFELNSSRLQKAIKTSIKLQDKYG